MFRKWNCILLAFLSFIIIKTLPAQDQVDVEGGHDHPLFSRMPGFYMGEYIEKDFDSYESPYCSAPDNIWEGKLFRIGYVIKTGAKSVSMTQIARNYENAVKKIGGQILFSDSRNMSAKIVKNRSVTYVEASAYNDGTSYSLVIVEGKPMDQEVTADADALSQSIANSGKAAVYGIYFDTGLSIIKPESKPALNEIIKLLNLNPKLSLYVVGHTDSDGALESNLKLSTDRANAVVKALTDAGIAAARLKAAGVGPYCPVASNKSADGKALNRRVELVEKN
jgi:outer membrane protein OmpA-like peptidoglycan-associated protein